MTADSRPVIVARNRCVVPKERRIERFTFGYVIRELCDKSQGRYWYVVGAFGLTRSRKANPIAA